MACAQLAARPLEEAGAALDDILLAIRSAKRRRADLVVLPECAYPGYVLLSADPYRRPIPSAGEALQRICKAAARHEIHVAVGMARKARRGLENQAILIDDTGVERAVVAKSLLWSFDARWFARGGRPRVAYTRFGRIGMLVCADGRVPEIARSIAEQGAWLILDPTAWVGYGTSFDALQNPQAQYVLRIRAFENGVWIAAADKCGAEHSAVFYVGASQIVAPSGEVVARAGVADPEIIVAAVAPPRRRTHFTSVRAAANVLGQRARKTAAAGGTVWLGVYQAFVRAAPDEHDTIATLQAQGADIIVKTAASAARLRTVFANAQVLRSTLVEGRAFARPESARPAARAGADLVVWSRPPNNFPVLDLARTRALENRVYVLVCTTPRPDVSTCLIDPNGLVVAAALCGAPSAFLAALELASARRKLVVPGTNVFEGT
ncbi:MAG: hypothetical protein M3Z37_00290 [Candidatus Eremiobacteraeota bacterium]|nr:hypothetical protein [Candidatus Eremiobacteraeota bacterium]